MYKVSYKTFFSWASVRLQKNQIGHILKASCVTNGGTVITPGNVTAFVLNCVFVWERLKVSPAGRIGFLWGGSMWKHSSNTGSHRRKSTTWHVLHGCSWLPKTNGGNQSWNKHKSSQRGKCNVHCLMGSVWQWCCQGLGFTAPRGHPYLEIPHGNATWGHNGVAMKFKRQRHSNTVWSYSFTSCLKQNAQVWFLIMLKCDKLHINQPC